MIDENLNWKQHIERICLKISKTIGILYRIRHDLTIEALLSIYYTLCYPHLIYCVSIWGCTWPSFTIRLIIAQNKIFRCIYFLIKFDSVAHIYAEENVLTFEHVHQYSVILLIYRSKFYIQTCQ